MGKVSIGRINQGIKEGLVKVLDLLGGLEHFIDRNDRIMLKPNLNGEEGCTNIELVECLLQLLLDLNVKKVFIAESTFGTSQITNMFFNKTGYSDLAKKYNIDLVNLNKSEVVRVKVEKPLILEKINIAKEVFEADKIINLPNMKVHYATGVTLAMKNLKGFLVGDEKKHFHTVGLDKAIVDLNNTIKVHLNIVDCISCMERMGPRGGDIVKLNLLIAGENIAEVDYVGTQIMSYGVDEVKHLKYYLEMNKVDLDSVEVVGEDIGNVKYRFKKVDLKGIVPKGFRIHNRDACSSCMNAFLLSCFLLQDKLDEDMDVYLGSLVEEDDISEGFKIGFGNCCPKEINFEKRINGCPPYPYLLRDLIEKIKK